MLVRAPVLIRQTSAVLLKRRVAHAQGVCFLRGLVDHLVRRAEVQQHRLARVLADHDVVRADVAVHDVLLVQHVQVRGQRKQQRGRCGPAELAPALHAAGQRFPVHKLHHDVRRAVVLKAVMHAHDMRERLYADQRLRLLQRAALAALKDVLLVLHVAEQPDRHAVFLTVNKPPREALLYRDFPLQGKVVRGIGHAKPSAAQNAVYSVLSPEYRTKGQMIVGILAHLEVSPKRQHSASASSFSLHGPGYRRLQRSFRSAFRSLYRGSFCSSSRRLVSLPPVSLALRSLMACFMASHSLAACSLAIRSLSTCCLNISSSSGPSMIPIVIFSQACSAGSSTRRKSSSSINADLRLFGSSKAASASFSPFT